METLPLNGGLGAEMRGTDLSRDLSPHDIAEIRSAWMQHQVLLFREQRLDDDRLIRFTRCFGELEFPPSKLLNYSKGSGQKDEVPPEINVISNVRENGKPIGQLGAGEAHWHTDSAFVEEPPLGSVLHAHEIPPSGGNTSFLNMYAAYEALPVAMKERIDGLSVNHDPTFTSVGDKRHDYDLVDDPSQAPGVHHPIVRTHPETGRKALYLGRRLNAWVVGLPVPESEALLDALWEHTLNPRFTYEHVWRVGDLVMWDNRCTMHRREAFDDSARRIMHRTQIKGDRPIA